MAIKQMLISMQSKMRAALSPIGNRIAHSIRRIDRKVLRFAVAKRAPLVFVVCRALPELAALLLILWISTISKPPPGVSDSLFITSRVLLVVLFALRLHTRCWKLLQRWNRRSGRQTV